MKSAQCIGCGEGFVPDDIEAMEAHLLETRHNWVAIYDKDDRTFSTVRLPDHIKHPWRTQAHRKVRFLMEDGGGSLNRPKRTAVHPNQSNLNESLADLFRQARLDNEASRSVTVERPRPPRTPRTTPRQPRTPYTAPPPPDPNRKCEFPGCTNLGRKLHGGPRQRYCSSHKSPARREHDLHAQTC
jgi:hypothetical protein